MRAKTIGNSQLRSFGLIVGTGFAVIGVAPMVFRGHPPRLWAVALGIVLSALALVLPSVLRPVHRVWMTLGEGLGWVNSRIILGVVDHILIVPIGVIRRLSGNDPMRRRFERDAVTYKIRRTKRPASHMQRQDQNLREGVFDMVEFISELWSFMNERKRFWLVPIVVMLVLLSGLMFLTTGTAVAPFIYTLF